MFPHEDMRAILVSGWYVDILLLGRSCGLGVYLSYSLTELLSKGPWFVGAGFHQA